MNNVKKIALLKKKDKFDQLEWKQVKQWLETLFGKTDIHIQIYNYIEGIAVTATDDDDFDMEMASYVQ